MYRQGYLDQARVRNQFAYYPAPNFPAYAGFTDTMKALPTMWYEGVKEMKMDQVIGAVGLAMVVATPFVMKKGKKVSKKIPLTKKQAVMAGVGSVMTAYSLYKTYSEIA